VSEFVKGENDYAIYYLIHVEGSMKFASKMHNGQPEILSGARLVRSNKAYAEREKLAARVEKLAVEAFKTYELSLQKLSELRPLIAELREQFMNLKPGEKIAACRTWTEYCERVLHRTDRRIRQILKGANPASEKHGRKSLPAEKNTSVSPESKPEEAPETQTGEWTLEEVIKVSFDFVFSVFEKAKLPDEDHNQALLQLIDRLRHEVFLGSVGEPAEKDTE